MALIFHPKDYQGEESPAELIRCQGIPKDGVNWCESVVGRKQGKEVADVEWMEVSRNVNQ